jgi:predicted Zn finger-like uncharacterized protein
LYTQCPECATVFRVTADALRVAQGTVRCGICSSSFNAIEYLNEQPIPRQSDEPAHEDTITVEEVPGTEFIELSAAATAGDPPPEFLSSERQSPEEQAGHSLDEAEDADLEFHGSIQDLERLFVTAEPRPLWPAAGAEPAGVAGQDDGGAEDFETAIGAIADGEFSGIEVREERLPGGLEHDDSLPGRIAAILAFPAQRGPAADATGDQPKDTPTPEAEDALQAAGTAPDDGVAAEDPDRTDEYPVLVLAEHDDDSGARDDDEPESVEVEYAPASAEAETDATTIGEPDAGAGEAPEADAVREPAAGGADPGAQPPAAEDETLLLLIPEELRREHAESAASAFEPAAESGPAVRRWPWFIAAAALLAVLATQAIHFWRHDLSRNPAVGPWLMRAYSEIGIPLTPPVDLSAFELRQLGAASDGLQAGRIKLRASIVNRAAFAQPLPLIRLSLQDRFGSTIATRDLDATEYLPGGASPASGLLGPSQRADAEVVFVDPGRDAVGFELDLCLREAAGVRCSAAAEERP